MKTNLQVPVEKHIKESSAQVALEYGFSSLQDAVRMFLTQLASRTITIHFHSDQSDEILTQKQEEVLTNKYKEVLKEIKAGKAYAVKNAEELIKNLELA